MSKIVDTNQAWDLFEKLEDSYFNLREVYIVMLSTIDEMIQLAASWNPSEILLRARRGHHVRWFQPYFL